MEIKGTIIHAMPEVSGVSKAGNSWKKKEYVLENTEGNFPRKVAFTCFGENADRIQAAINQLQKAVNRAGRKKREISQENLTAKRQARLEKEKRTRQAKRLRHQLKNRQTQRILRESGYLREAEIDNRLQGQLSAARLELREQMRQLSESTQVPVDAAVEQYAAAAAPPAPPPEISVEA